MIDQWRIDLKFYDDKNVIWLVPNKIRATYIERGWIRIYDHTYGDPPVAHDFACSGNHNEAVEQALQYLETWVPRKVQA